jgi:asparagine synthase (glutamine-hydrolysing)
MKGGDLLRVSVTGIERLTGDRLYFDVVGPRDRPAAAVELRARVEQAIGGAAGDPETCVSLSGGLDSTVVAALVARRRRSVDALSLVAPAFSQRDDGAAIAAAAAIPGVRHHRIEVTDDIFGPLAFLPDDPVCAAPVLEAGRRALLGAARAAGFRRVIDGEGGDELFDLAWWSRDLIFEGAVRQVVARLTRRSSLSRLVSEFAVSAGLAPVSGFRVEPLERRLRRQRPWLREALWEGPGFAAATAQSRSYWSLRSARRRLPLVLASHGRYWRAQETVRSSLGVEGMSPLLHREVIEFVGSLPADTVMAPHHGKALLRCLATQLVPPAIAWRRKREPLSEWLAERFIASDDRVAAGVGFIIESRVLREVVDPSAVLAAVGQARRERQAAQIQSLVELFTLAEWIATVQSRYGV